jgi:hypothetical protein
MPRLAGCYTHTVMRTAAKVIDGMPPMAMPAILEAVAPSNKKVPVHFRNPAALAAKSMRCRQTVVLTLLRLKYCCKVAAQCAATSKLMNQLSYTQQVSIAAEDHRDSRSLAGKSENTRAEVPTRPAGRVGPAATRCGTSVRPKDQGMQSLQAVSYDTFFFHTSSRS